MSFYENFLEIYPLFCLLLINLPILAMAIPNRLINTASLNLNWVLVGLIFSGVVGLRSITFSLFLISVISIAVLIHYVRQPKKVKTILPIADTQQQDLFKRVK